jgi:hypothetical protein
MPAKKTDAKKTPRKAAAKTAAPARTKSNAARISLPKWFFVPDLKQGIAAWAARAGLFLIVICVMVLFLGALGIIMQLLENGIAPPSVWKIIHALCAGALQRPLLLITAALSIFAVGLFAFAPRKPLDRTSFAAALFSFTFWAAVFVGGPHLLGGTHRDAVLFPLAVLAMIAVIGIIAAIVCHARSRGVSKAAVLLSAPFGLPFFEYAGLFLPDVGKEKAIAIKFKWYEKLVGFLMKEKAGQIILAVLAVLPAVMGTYWELLLIALFAALYFLRGREWVAGNIVRLSWIAAAFNIAAIATFGYLFIVNLPMAMAG